MQTPFDSSIYQGRLEPFENERARYWYQHIAPFGGQSVALVGFGCDQGVQRNQGRIGAKHAPDVIKAAFGKLSIGYDLQAAQIGDAGNVLCVDNDAIGENLLENAQAAFSEKIASLVAQQVVPIGIGGGHEIAWASFKGLYDGLQVLEKQGKISKNARIGIINLDAHFDLRSDKYATSGTPFLQIAQFLQEQQQPFDYLTIGISEFANTASLFEKAENLGVQIVSESECLRLDFGAIEQRIQAFIDSVDAVYVTLDLDVLQAGFMPAVSAVNASGLSMDFVMRCLQSIIATGKVRLCDMAEFNPKFDIDGRGAKVAGRLLALMAGALYKQTV